MIPKVLCFVVLVLGLASGSPVPNDEGLNNLIDMILNMVDQSILDSGLDPAHLPDAVLKFEETVMFVKWHGEASAYNGTLSGMSSVHRLGESEYVFDDKGRAIGATTTISMNVMEGYYKYVAQFMELGPAGDIELRIEGIRLTLTTALDEHLCVFSLKELNIDNIGNISIKIHGLGLLDWITNAFVSLIANVVEVFLRNIIESQVKNIMNGVLDNFDLYPYRWFVPFIHCDKRPFPTAAPLIH
ncbi:mite allergen Lep d 7-like [Palaemon carinicauda]|uniref:mite allergen Lep d 7-like n=1 Tax=Palaemon carinicauda TaxID=392227 RepID=UPI0035B5925D